MKTVLQSYGPKRRAILAQRVPRLWSCCWRWRWSTARCVRVCVRLEFVQILSIIQRATIAINRHITTRTGLTMTSSMIPIAAACSSSCLCPEDFGNSAVSG
jgi:hypothetical protein